MRWFYREVWICLSLNSLGQTYVFDDGLNVDWGCIEPSASRLRLYKAPSFYNILEGLSDRLGESLEATLVPYRDGCGKRGLTTSGETSITANV